MLLRRFYDDKLAQASYMVGCQATGEALVVDPHRDSDLYLQAAEAEEMEIRYVTETHIHADYLSGARQLARRTGATLLLSGHGGDDWSYTYAEDDGARLVFDGDRIEMGKVRIDVLHTPGHTPEHLSFMITDGAATDEPMGVLTGDFVFVGDVGRPDLLERAAGVAGTMEAGARVLYRSLERFRNLPPHLQILPGHGAGSACGKALGSVPSSTLGYELIANWAFQCATEDEFVAKVLEDQPEPPAYFAHMKRLNRDGPPLLDGLPSPRRLAPEGLPALLDTGAVVVDTRDPARYAAGHVPGTWNIPLTRSFPNWVGSLVPFGTPVHLIADGEAQVREAVRDLVFIGYDAVPGWLGPDALEVWAARRGGLSTIPVVDWDAAERARRTEGALLLDVRRSAEWREAHPPGAAHIHLGHLPARLEEVPRDRPVLVSCRTGHRSAIAASLLAAAGHPDVRNVEGGIVDRVRRGLEVVSGS